jgi:hypothetical protein
MERINRILDFGFWILDFGFWKGCHLKVGCADITSFGLVDSMFDDMSRANPFTFVVVIPN